MPPKRNHKSLIRFVCFALVILGVFLFFKNDAAQEAVKNAFRNNGFNALLDTIQKEISTPGALIAKIESSNAFLTKGGVFSFTNKERYTNSLTIFSGNTKLDQVAESRLQDMFTKQYFEHVSPTGDSASSVAESVGYEYISIGENIALGNFEDDTVLVAAWMASPGHRANILNERFTELGVAVGKGTYKGKTTWIGVQIFARPLSLCKKIDENLKASINLQTSEMKALQEEIKKVEEELEVLSRDKNRNRDEYNQKVDQYNLLAREINDRIQKLKSDVATYNVEVKVFNSCISA